jgi:hypothetical protein
VFRYPKFRASDCSFFSDYGRQVSGVSIFLLGEVNVSCGRGGRGRGLLFPFFVVDFSFGGWGSMGFIYLFFLLWGGPTTEGRGHFLCCCFVCVGWWHNEGADHTCHKHIEKPLFDIMVFLKFKIILKPLEAIYMCRLLQLLLCVGMGELKAFWTFIFSFYYFSILLFFIVPFNFKMFNFKFQSVCKILFWIAFRLVVCKANIHIYSNIHLFTKCISSYSFASYTFLDDEKKGEKWVFFS